MSRVGYKHVCDPHLNIPFQADVRTTTQWQWMLLGVSDVISLPLPHTEKTLTALRVKFSSLLAVRVRSWARIIRMRGCYFEQMPVEVWKILHGLLVITNQQEADSYKSHHCFYPQGPFSYTSTKGLDGTHTHTIQL